MILTMKHLGETRHLRNSKDISRSLDEVFHSEGEPTPYASAAWVLVESEASPTPVSMLEVSINLVNGLGGAVWCAWENAPDTFPKNPEDAEWEYAWVSDNEEPLGFDPEVLSDPHCPSYFDPRGVISVGKIREVVEEYCHLLGNRPNGIRWVPGHLNGTRPS